MAYLLNHTILTYFRKLLFKTLVIHLIPIYPKREESLSYAKRKMRISFEMTVF